jgi:hypothetical protein
MGFRGDPDRVLCQGLDNRLMTGVPAPANGNDHGQATGNLSTLIASARCISSIPRSTSATCFALSRTGREAVFSNSHRATGALRALGSIARS